MAPSSPVVGTSACPSIVAYSAAEQGQAAVELKALPAGSMLARFVEDYATERAELRACQPRG